MSECDRTAAEYLATIRDHLGNSLPPEPERAAWEALDLKQRRFVLRALGLSDTLTFAAMNPKQRRAFRRAVEGWAGTAARLRQIIEGANAEQLRQHREAVGGAA